jgi:mannosyltransferase OCH1-like enzyme
MKVIIAVTVIVIILLVILFFKKSENYTGIPKIIHQTAPGDQSKWHEIWPKCQESWKRNFPDWEYRMWTDEDLDEFMKTKYPEYYSMYTGYDMNIKRIDAARYFIMKEYGGIYADMDFECIKNFEDAIPPDKVSVAESAFQGEGFQNALMISPKGHKFWDAVLVDLDIHQNDPHPHNTTGPQVIVRVNSSHPGMVNSLPSSQFSVVTDPYYKAKKETFDRTDSKVYTVHHGTCSWCSL